jgi:hypothetical protein
MLSGLEIFDVKKGKIKYYRTPQVFAVEIRKYHQKIPLERYYILKQCKIAIKYKLVILEQSKLVIPYLYTIYLNNVKNVSLRGCLYERWDGHLPGLDDEQDPNLYKFLLYLSPGSHLSQDVFFHVNTCCRDGMEGGTILVY